MAQFDLQSHAFVGSAGTLCIPREDQASQRLAMLVEGECELGPKAAAAKFGLSRQRYFQLRKQFSERGAEALLFGKRGPKQNYRRTSEVIRQIIRHRFLDAEASSDVIAQKLRQTGFVISARSVERVIAEYGLQKKTVSLSASL